MSITINFNPTDMQNISQAVIKELHNIAYRKKLDTSFDNMAKGKWVEHELIEVDDAQIMG